MLSYNFQTIVDIGIRASLFKQLLYVSDHPVKVEIFNHPFLSLGSQPCAKLRIGCQTFNLSG